MGTSDTHVAVPSTISSTIQCNDEGTPAWIGTRKSKRDKKFTIKFDDNTTKWHNIYEDTDLYWIADRELYDWDRQIRFSWQQSSVHQSGNKPRKGGLDPSSPLEVNRAYAAAIGKANGHAHTLCMPTVPSLLCLESPERPPWSKGPLGSKLTKLEKYF